MQGSSGQKQIESKQITHLRMFSDTEDPIEAEDVALSSVSIDLAKGQICRLLYCGVITGGGQQCAWHSSGRRRGSPGAKPLYAKEH